MEPKRNVRPRGLVLPILGILLLAFGFWGMARVPDLLQYRKIAPVEMPVTEEQDTASELSGLIDRWKETRSGLTEVLSESAMGAVRHSVTFTSPEGSATAKLWGTGEGWFGVYPKYLVAGRLPSQEELEKGARVAVIDQPLALKLFPTIDPIGEKIQIEQAWYEVVGVTRYARNVGESEQYSIYVPLAALADGRVQMDLLEIAAVPIPKSGASRAMEEAVRTQWSEGGTFHDLSKEIMRCTMIVRLLSVFFLFCALFALLRRLNRRVLRGFANWKEQLKRTYLRSMLGNIAWKVLMWLAGYAALIGAAYGLLTVLIEPMMVFTEWIPEVIVELSSISERFWGLTSSAAAPVFLRTEEYAQIRFYGAILRWGVIVTLSGAIVFLLAERRRRRDGKDTNLQKTESAE